MLPLARLSCAAVATLALLGLGASGGGAQTPLSFSLHAGAALPSGDVTGTHDAGFAVGAAATLELSPRIGVQAALEGFRLSRQDQAALDRIGFENGTRFESGGGFLEGGHRTFLALMANVEFRLAGPGARLTPFLLAGVGPARNTLGDTDVFFLGEWETFEGDDATGLALRGGGGLRLSVHPNLSLQAEVAYLSIPSREGSASAVPIRIGASLDLAALGDSP